MSLALNPALSEKEVFDERILGGGSFVENILDATGEGAQNSTLSLMDLVRQVAAQFDLAPEELSLPCKARKIVRAKAVICYLAVRRLRFKGIEVAEHLGYSSTAVTHAATRGEVIFSETPGLGAKLGIGEL